MSVHVGPQDLGAGTPSRYLASMISWSACNLLIIKGVLLAHIEYFLLQESGLARILMPELGLETVMRINRPAKPGDDLDICVAFIDVPKGIYKFNEAASGQTASSQDVDSQDEPDSGEDGEAAGEAVGVAVGEADNAASVPVDPAEADTAVVTS